MTKTIEEEKILDDIFNDDSLPIWFVDIIKKNYENTSEIKWTYPLR